LSNKDTTYHRNRIRHVLIPNLATYNPQIKTVIWRMADVLRADAQHMNLLTEQVFLDCLQGENDEQIRLSLIKFLELSMALKRRVFRQAVNKLRPDLRDVGFDVIDRGVTFAEQSSRGSEIDLVARLNMAIIEDEIIIKTWQVDLPDFGKPCLTSAQFEGWLDCDNAVDLRHGWRIEASLITDVPEQALVLVKNLGHDEVWLDFDRLTLPLKVRGREEGERFQPLGMGGHSQGLQDFFVNLKLPSHLRRVWPLVVSGQRVVWVVGLRPSEDCKITNDTRQILKLKLVKSKN
jgi:tRNA(Ile)-lysidine synthase